MRAVVALFVVLLAGHPLAVLPTKPVAIAAGAAVVVCALGVALRYAPVFVVGVAIALGAHALALVLSDSPPRLAGALVAGVVAALTLEVADFERRFRQVTIGPGVIRAQLVHWGTFAAIGVLAGFALTAAAGGVNATARVPWSPVVAAAGAVIALAAVAVALRRS